MPKFDPRPPRLAVDAEGYVWRVYPEYWSMCPVNPDNEPVPEPVTYYELVEPAEVHKEPMRLADKETL
jgi:hypothetical protein